MSGAARGRTIFLVDDDADFLEMNRGVLAAGGYDVACYNDPAEALAAIGRGPPSLVVTDLMMDALDSGFSLARAIKTDPRLPAIPVIIVTAVSSRRGFDFHPRSAADLAAMHADAVFDKPVAPSVLLAKVKELIG